MQQLTTAATVAMLNLTTAATFTGNNNNNNSISGSSTTISALAEMEQEAALYNETYEPETDNVESGQLITDVIIIPLIFTLVFVIGAVGNALVIAVIMKIHFPKQQDLNNTQLYMLNLAVADLFFLIVCVPVGLVIHVTEGWLMGEFMCHFMIFAETISMFASAYTLVALSFDR